MKEYGVGIDVGGTTVKIGIFKNDGTLLEKWEIPTDTSNAGENILSDIAAAVNAKLAEMKIEKDDVEGIGIGVPGPVVNESSVQMCVNLGWGEKNIAEEMQNLTGFSVKVGNDANVAALGEMWMGGGKGHSNVLMVTLGTGVGGGLIIDGKIIEGSHGAGAEIGHITVNSNESDACNCGRKGCLEQYCSATGIVRMTKKLLEKVDTASTLREGEISAKSIFDAAKAGDGLAKQSTLDFANVLARALSTISCVADPDMVVIGGGVSKAGQILIDEIENAYKGFAFGPCKDTKFTLAELGNDAGMYGCAKMIFHQ